MSDATPKEPQTIQIHNLKSNFFRVVHADGTWCSVNPQKEIHVAFYSERFPIPDSIFLEVDEKGIVKGENFSKRQAKKDWVREMEVEVVLTVPAAKAVVGIFNGS